MNFISWNCRGMVNRNAVLHAKDLMCKNYLGVCCFLETRTTNAHKIKKMARKRGFDHTFEVDPIGFTRGLLLFWRNDAMVLAVARAQNSSHPLSR